MFKSDAIRPITFSKGAVVRTHQFAPDLKSSEPGAVFEQLKNISTVRQLGEVLNAWSSKFKFGTTPRSVWQHKYRYSASSSTYDDDRVVNANSDTVQAYVADIILMASSKEKPPVTMLVGGIGAGKSTFNKLVTTTFHDAFKEAGIVASRVEFQKLREHLELHPKLDQRTVIETWVFATLLRDLQFYTYAQQSGEASAEPFDISDRCKLPRRCLSRDEFDNPDFVEVIDRIMEIADDAEYQQFELTRDDIVRFLKHFTRFKSMQPLDRSGLVPFWAKFILSDNAANRKIGAAAELFVRVMFRNLKPFIIFDGFDYIGVNDFHADRTLSSILNWLSRTVIREEGPLLPISGRKLWPLVQITIRETTNQLFWCKRLASVNQVRGRTLRVEAPSIDGVIDGLDDMLRELVPNSDEIRPVLTTMLSGSIVHLHQRLRRSDVDPAHDFEPADLFQKNSRHLMNFLRDYLEIELSKARAAMKKRDVTVVPHTLAIELQAQYSRIIDHSSYVLVQILLSSRSSRYQNFVAFEAREDGGIRPRDNDNESGYIGNVFNFHADYEFEQGLREFTHKLLILAHLCETGRRMDANDIAEEIGFDPTFTRSALAMMIRENMVDAWFSPKDTGTLYCASKLGDIIYHHLIYELSYVESVFFGASIPSGFIDAELQDVFRTPNVRRWVHGSVANIVLLLRMMTTANESHTAISGRDGLSRLVGRMADSLGLAFERIARSENEDGPILTQGDVDRILERQRVRLG